MLFVRSSLGNANQNSVAISSYPSQNDSDQQNNQYQKERMLSRVREKCSLQYAYFSHLMYMSGAWKEFQVFETAPHTKAQVGFEPPGILHSRRPKCHAYRF